MMIAVAQCPLWCMGTSFVIPHPSHRKTCLQFLAKSFYFVFFSERMKTKWVMSSEEFLKECVTNTSGKNKGKQARKH
ncbi:MAG: hypothetical protein J6X55_01225 [Victivallales bacterium]|nr:hypothetical protein [Victivallales bacterium]